jgi:hypothetical protein
MRVTWETRITRNGSWPTPWRWEVWRKQHDPIDVKLRTGYAVSKDRARRKALRAKLSMERDDVQVTL